MLASCFALPPTVEAQVSFRNVTMPAGLDGYRATSGDTHGAAGIFSDLDNDGFPDLYLTQSGQPNQLFVNTPGGQDRVFTELQDAGGAGDTGSAIGAIAGDYDNDGDRDVFVINYSGRAETIAENVLYRNQLIETGTLSFLDVTASTDPTPHLDDDQFGLRRAEWNGQVLDNNLAAAWGDPDRDGDLDLYIGNHDNTIHDFGEHGLPGQRDIFYLNNGDGTFRDATEHYQVRGFETALGDTETRRHEYSSSNAVAWADFDNDGWQDLLVTNKVGGEYDRDMLYLNKGADEAGVWQGFEIANYSLPSTFGHRTIASMGVDVGDVDNDGDLDIYLTDWSNPKSFPNNGSNDIWFNQLSDTGNLDFKHSSSLSALFSWGTQIEDFNNDGFQDIHVATERGAADFLFLHNGEDALGNPTRLYTDVSVASGINQTQNSRGDLAADYNRDGKLDLFVVNLDDAESALFENQSEDENNFLSLQLTGAPQNPNGFFATSLDAIGSRAYVTADLDGDGELEPHETLIREVISGSSNSTSTSSLALEFGVGLAESADISIHWTSGRVTDLSTATNQFLRIYEETPVIGPSRPGDCNSDERLTAADLGCVASLHDRDLVLDALQTHPGDLNGDGAVNFVDFQTLANHYGQDQRSYALGNIDLVGGVGFADFIVLSSNFGKTSAAVRAVPELQTATPWMMGLVLFMPILRRRLTLGRSA